MGSICTHVRQCCLFSKALVGLEPGDSNGHCMTPPCRFPQLPRGFWVVTKYNWGITQWSEWFSIWERGWVFKICLCILIRRHTCMCTYRSSGGFFPYLKHLFPSSTLPLLPLEITVSLWWLACLKLYYMIFWAEFLVPCLCLKRKQQAPQV